MQNKNKNKLKSIDLEEFSGEFFNWLLNIIRKISLK